MFKNEVEALRKLFKDNFKQTSDPNRYLIKSFKTTDPDFDHTILPEGLDLQIFFNINNSFDEEKPKQLAELTVLDTNVEHLDSAVKTLQKDIDKAQKKLLKKNLSGARTLLKLVDKKIPLYFRRPEDHDEVQRIEDGRKSGDIIQLKEYYTQNIGYSHIAAVVLQLSCGECGLGFTSGLTPAEKLFEDMDDVKEETRYIKRWCSNKQCSKLLSGKFYSELLHQENTTRLGTFTCEGEIDLLLISFYVTCLECGETQLMVNVERGKMTREHCYSCHAELKLQFSGINISRLNNKPAPVFLRASSKSKQSKMKNFNNIVLSQGEALPKKGACEHYKKSYRWFRFPCCQQSFPCDICHEKAQPTPKCQGGIFANRQICGLCSTEQGIKSSSESGQECNYCHKVLGGKNKVGNSRHHWEGGKGMRDKTFLDRREKKKYTGSKNKTRSNKQNRVGKSGSEKANKTKAK
eukprot:snap_masked-scaffold_15-processed-gene-6.7-mRNA-1 protein AED:0.34 eAED:0.34 QI:0/0/0/0.5/1/1/2/0/462